MKKMGQYFMQKNTKICLTYIRANTKLIDKSTGYRKSINPFNEKFDSGY